MWVGEGGTGVGSSLWYREGVKEGRVAGGDNSSCCLSGVSCRREDASTCMPNSASAGEGSGRGQFELLFVGRKLQAIGRKYLHAE